MASSFACKGDWLTAHSTTRFMHGIGNLGIYEIGGVEIPTAATGLGLLEDLHIYPVDDYIFEWNKSNSRVKVYETSLNGATRTEIDVKDISENIFRWQAIGR